MVWLERLARVWKVGLNPAWCCFRLLKRGLARRQVYNPKLPKQTRNVRFGRGAERAPKGMYNTDSPGPVYEARARVSGSS